MRTWKELQTLRVGDLVRVNDKVPNPGWIGVVERVTSMTGSFIEFEVVEGNGYVEIGRLDGVGTGYNEYWYEPLVPREVTIYECEEWEENLIL